MKQIIFLVFMFLQVVGHSQVEEVVFRNDKGQIEQKGQKLIQKSFLIFIFTTFSLKLRQDDLMLLPPNERTNRRHACQKNLNECCQGIFKI